MQSFLAQAAALSSTTAAHRSNLELAINRLPRLLAVAQPSLAQLDVVAREGTPLVQQIGVAAPYLNKVSRDLGPFVAQAKPGLAKLSTALTQAIPAIRHATPLVAALGSYTTRSLAKTQQSGRLFTSLQHAGFIENFLGIVYYVGASVARFDQKSHLLDFAIENIQNGACIQYATTPVPGCGANYGSAPASAARPASVAAARAGTGSAVSAAGDRAGTGNARARNSSASPSWAAITDRGFSSARRRPSRVSMIPPLTSATVAYSARRTSRLIFALLSCSFFDSMRRRIWLISSLIPLTRWVTVSNSSASCPRCPPKVST